jgi:hypothetical protein
MLTQSIARLPNGFQRPASAASSALAAFDKAAFFLSLNLLIGAFSPALPSMLATTLMCPHGHFISIQPSLLQHLGTGIAGATGALMHSVSSIYSQGFCRHTPCLSGSGRCSCLHAICGAAELEADLHGCNTRAEHTAAWPPTCRVTRTMVGSGGRKQGVRQPHCVGLQRSSAGAINCTARQAAHGASKGVRCPTHPPPASCHSRG